MKLTAIAAVCAVLVACSAPCTEETPPVDKLAPSTPEETIQAIPEPEPEPNMIEGVLLTHYCICEKCCGKTPDHPAYGITASGREAVPYISVAVDPDIIPLGSTVWLMFSDGGRIQCRADDTGSAIQGARIDLCVSSHTEALEHGIDYITVYWEVEEDVSY